MIRADIAGLPPDAIAQAEPRRRLLNVTHVVAEVGAVKRLLVLQLVTSGIHVRDIAHTLRCTEKEVRRWIPKKLLRQER